jgi:Ca-activated chloride channel homolog
MKTSIKTTVKPIVLMISALLLSGCVGNPGDSKLERMEQAARERSNQSESDKRQAAPSGPDDRPVGESQVARSAVDQHEAETAAGTISQTAAAPQEAAPEPLAVADAAPPAPPPPPPPMMMERKAPAKTSADLAQAPLVEPNVDAENYAAVEANPIQLVSEQAVSTFSVDVDTGSYTNVRRMLLGENRLPPQDAVRAEEFINYFDYQYPHPANRTQPFSVTTELGAAPWNSARELLLIGLQGFEMQKAEMPAANLVLLLDVSGSMDEPDKLPLLKASMLRMLERLSDRDRVSIVVYAGAAGLVLPPTPASDRARIAEALQNLSAGGSTNGGQGIALAYSIAKENFIKGGVNRILLATDGDFNVGQFNANELKDFVAAQRESGVQLSTLGFGTGNYNDEMAEQLADVGNGQYSYIDSLKESDRVLGRELVGSLFTIASDVKVQVEFNPSVVSEYRLIGYANRKLAREDFNNDKVDAGDIGVGHQVTALYEITRVGAKSSIDPSRYQPSSTTYSGNELAFLKLRYKLPNQTESILIETPISSTPKSSKRLQDAASIGAFAESLQGGKYLGSYSVAQMLQSVEKGSLPADQKSDVLELMQRALALKKGEPLVQISEAN